MKTRIVKAMAAVSTLALSSVAMAQESAGLPSWASDIGADAQATATDAAALVGPVIGFVLVSLVAIKLIKRFVNRI